MDKESRYEKKLKKYIMQLAEKELNNSEAFIKVYGKDFVKKKLDQNFKEVHIYQEENQTRPSYNVSDNKIYLPKIYMLDNNMNYSNIAKAVLIHESIHAMLFRKTFDPINDVSMVVGTQEIYDNGSELGRGLDEGYTEWLVEQTGIESGNDGYYKRLKEFAYELEALIGKENMMKLGKEYTLEKATDILGQSEFDVIELLNYTDMYYNLNDQISGILSINNRISNIVNPGTVSIDYDDLKQYEQLALDKEMLHSSKDEFTDYINENISNKKSLSEQYERKFESKIYELYLKEECETLKQSETVSFEQFERLYNFKKVVGDKFSVEEFYDSFKIISDKYMEVEKAEIEQELNNGSFDLKNLEKISEKYEKHGIDCGKIYDVIAKRINPENYEYTSDLIKFLSSSKRIEDLDKYYMQEIATQSGEKSCLYYKDNEVQYAYKKIEPYILNSQQNDFDTLELFFGREYFKSPESEKEYDIIMELKEKMEQKNLNPSLRVMDEIININTENGKEMTVLLKNEKFERMMPTEKEKEKIVIDYDKFHFSKQEQSEPTQALMIPKKDNILKRGFKKFTSMFKKKEKNKEKPNIDNKASDRKGFLNSIKFKASDIQETNINSNETENQKKEDYLDEEYR